jgi:Trk K+ transport system NAD-binding subunit
MNKVSESKNSITIFGYSDISNFIVDSFLKSSNHYDITLIVDQKDNSSNSSLVRTSNQITLKKKNLSDAHAINENDYKNNLLTILATNDTKLNILSAALIKSTFSTNNIYCCINDVKYDELFNTKGIEIFYPWNLPPKLKHFWK